MKLADAFPKATKPLSAVASGETLMRLLEDGKAGRITIHAMETTKDNGTYKIFYENSTQQNIN